MKTDNKNKNANSSRNSNINTNRNTEKNTNDLQLKYSLCLYLPTLFGLTYLVLALSV